jgi:fructose-1,6-bisphosphatase/inositol monophosphatase family enzyme
VPSDPRFLQTAIDAVVRAGDMMMARLGEDVHIDKKGVIDLVTDVDVAVEQMFRALIAERFSDHHVLGEELGGSWTIPPGLCWVFDPIDGTTNFAHGLPIFCASVALELDGFWESDLKPWDVAGGALIVTEAGGRVTGMAGEPFSSRGRHVLASNGGLHDAMLDLIGRHQARNFR